jgi:putative ABC transport system substrate-binding protein
MMDRRAFLSPLAILAAPLAVEAQQAGRMWHIGVLPPSSSVGWFRHLAQAFQQQLREQGYVEGQNISIENRWLTEGRPDQLSALAAELVRLRVDVIVAASISCSIAAASSPCSSGTRAERRRTNPARA